MILLTQRITVDHRWAKQFFSEKELTYMAPQVRLAHQLLHEKSGPGRDFMGWLELPLTYSKDEVGEIKRAAERIRAESEALVVVGIGGSYLGARAAIEMLRPSFTKTGRRGDPVILYAGHHLSSDYLNRLLEFLGDRDFSVNVISKSGTTTEPAVAFRFLKQLLEKKYGREGAATRIYATTDRERGALRQLAEAEGYTRFVIPDDIGGRYSVLTPVGLLPIATAGIDIEQMLAGAGEACRAYSQADLEQNESYQYAALRQLFWRKGKAIELLVNYEPSLQYFAEWWKQLFGESEGKDGKGLYPASCDFTTDLHSLGQYLQDGRRIFLETVLRVENPQSKLLLSAVDQDLDGLNYLAGRSLDFLNEQALQGTVRAHADGGVPVVIINLPELSPNVFGSMVYFFEKACAVSGYLMGVNPFDQPGVEAYKNNMFALLGKEGYEERRQRLLREEEPRVGSSEG